MTDSEKWDRDRAITEMLDGGPIVEAVREASAQFFTDAFKVYKPAIEKMVKENVSDPRTKKIMDDMTETLITQMEQRLTKLFETPDKK